MPAIIDKELFHKVQAMLIDNKTKAGSNKARKNYMLSGLIFCGECKSTMTGNTRKNGKNKKAYASYNCSRRENKQCCNRGIRKKDINRYVIGSFYKLLFSNMSLDMLTKKLNAYNKIKSEDSYTEIVNGKRVLEKINTQIDNLTNQIANGSASDAINGKLRELEENKRYAERRLEELKSSQDIAAISPDEVFELIRKVNTTLIKDRAIECQNFLKSYLRKVYVYNDFVRVRFRVNKIPKRGKLLIAQNNDSEQNNEANK
jgi:site-specific DNA recombinase